jgi:hypothetical protein
LLGVALWGYRGGGGLCAAIPASIRCKGRLDTVTRAPLALLRTSVREARTQRAHADVQRFSPSASLAPPVVFRKLSSRPSALPGLGMGSEAISRGDVPPFHNGMTGYGDYLVTLGPWTSDGRPRALRRSLVLANSSRFDVAGKVLCSRPCMVVIKLPMYVEAASRIIAVVLAEGLAFQYPGTCPLRILKVRCKAGKSHEANRA